jgi:hypothetical protein
LITGCGVGSRRKKPAEIKVQRIEREKTELMRDLQQARAENEQLAQQIKALSAIPAEKRVNPYKISSIKITRYSNFYDKDDDGKREKFIVYFTPIDPEGDALKAAGTVNVQLWDLNNLNGQALVGQWQVEPEPLRGMWFDTLVSASYRLVFDTPEELDILANPLTVKVTFTDFLTGEIVRDQQPIDPRLDK